MTHDSLELMGTLYQLARGHLVVLTIQNPLFHIELLLLVVRNSLTYDH